MSGDWWRGAFADAYADVYAHRDDAAAGAEVAGLLPRLRAAPGPVLDACCGDGRHLAALLRAGVSAWGFDWSPQQAARAQARAECRGRVTRADVRAPAFADGAFGAVALLFTAFGYFEDADNGAVLATLVRTLAPGGWLLLDLPDADRLRATLVPASERRTPAGRSVRERRSLSGRRVEKTVEVREGEVVIASWRESVRLYADDEIRALLAANGLTAVERWASLRGAGMDEGRAVWWARRP